MGLLSNKNNRASARLLPLAGGQENTNEEIRNKDKGNKDEDWDESWDRYDDEYFEKEICAEFQDLDLDEEPVEE